jgi:hypothetical protein
MEFFEFVGFLELLFSCYHNNPMSPINRTISIDYGKRFIFFLIYVTITVKPQKERYTAC